MRNTLATRLSCPIPEEMLPLPTDLQEYTPTKFAGVKCINFNTTTLNNLDPKIKAPKVTKKGFNSKRRSTVPI